MARISYSGVVRASGHSVSARVEPNAVDIRLMTFEHLSALTGPHVPQHQSLVTTLKT